MRGRLSVIATTTPRVSVGLPVYNGLPYVRDAIDSLLAQEDADFELIVCDNASTDGTTEVVAEYAARDQRVRHHVAGQNRGAAANYNWAVELARGRYFKWAAADDVHRPSYLRRCVEVLEREPDVSIVYTRVVDIDGTGAEIVDWGSMPRATAGTPVQRFADVLDNERLAFPVFGVMRLDQLRRTSLIRPWSGSDYIVLSDLAALGRFVEIDEPLFLHREHEGRSTRAVKDLKERAQWFDTKRSGRWSMPWVMRFAWSLSTAVRLRRPGILVGTTAVTLRWAVRHWRYLGSDVRSVLRTAARR